jgi:hypothetical protein
MRFIGRVRSLVQEHSPPTSQDKKFVLAFYNIIPNQHGLPLYIIRASDLYFYYYRPKQNLDINKNNKIITERWH